MSDQPAQPPIQRTILKLNQFLQGWNANFNGAFLEFQDLVAEVQQLLVENQQLKTALAEKGAKNKEEMGKVQQPTPS